MSVMQKKSLLFLCKCGANISSFVDLDKVSDWASKADHIDLVESHNLLCSPDGKKFFQEMLKRKKPDTVVVAACSPKMHEKTFQYLAESADLNMSYIQMANIREHCAWVTQDKNEATIKSIELINAAAKRSFEAEPLKKMTMPVNTDMVVIGGGIAGIEAALSAAKADRKVYLVEKEISLGGAVIKTEDIAPSMECSPCLLAPRLSAVRSNPNITVITNAEVNEVKGFYGNFTVKIHKKARYVEESCIGCESCFEVCPVDVKSAFHLNMGTEKAIHTLFPGSVPAAAAIHQESCLHFVDNSCNACMEACPFGSINFNQKDEDIEVTAGAIIIATGFAAGDIAGIKNLKYGAIENIYTSSEFERLVCSNGPSKGELKLKNGEKPEKIAVIHCAGSMREDALPYCSGICCVEAAKVGMLVRKQLPDVQIVNIYQELVFPNPRDFSFYKQQCAAGTHFLKSDNIASVQLSEEKGRIRVMAHGIDPVEVDLVVLSTGLQPSESAGKLAEILNIDLEKDGFFKADHALLHATGASLDGIYIAGCAKGPVNVSDAVVTAHAAIGDALSKLVPGREIELEIMTACIDPDKCGGCKLCITTCPYKAISYNADKYISIVNEAICRGCGTCVAQCPSGAAKAKHFTDNQIYAEIGGLIYA